MLDLRESFITFEEATDILPPRQGGRRIHTATIRRWTIIGCCGVVLESIRVGKARYTSREALQRFLERLSAATARPTPVEAAAEKLPTPEQPSSSSQPSGA